MVETQRAGRFGLRFSLLMALGAGVGAGCGGGSAAAPPGPDAGADSAGEVATDDPWANCVWDGTVSMATPDTPLAGNNVADLTGAFLGDTTFDPAVQRKKVALTVDGLTPELQLGDGYLVRLTPTAEAAYLIIAVKNTSPTDLCQIKATNYRWLADDGTALFGGSGMETQYVDGTVRIVNGVDFTDGCLGPGESGYFTDVKSMDGASLYTKVAAIGVNLSGPFRSDGVMPAGRLVATGYDVGTCNKARSVKVTLSNTGTGSVSLENYSLSPAILLDDAGLPMGWLFLQTEAPVTVPAGGTASVFSSLFMEPKVRRLQVFMDIAGM